jgi:hypothetical protein
MEHFKVACEPFTYDTEDGTGKSVKVYNEKEKIDKDKALLYLVT